MPFPFQVLFLGLFGAKPLEGRNGLRGFLSVPQPGVGLRQFKIEFGIVGIDLHRCFQFAEGFLVSP
jgi:hypothetical protein